MQAQALAHASRSALSKLVSKAPAPKFNVEGSIHRARCLAQLRSKSSNLERYIYLNGLKGRDPALFYSLLFDNMKEIIPILYTPTVGEACQSYSHIWRRPEGLYISINDKGRIREVLSTWPNTREARISVVTDGSRILGLGDLGANGLPIAIGKLDLYIAGAGIRPSSTLPICLDTGTSTQKYLDDPLYLGVRRPRPETEEARNSYCWFREFMAAMRDVFPRLLVQFEDFSTDNAFRYLEMFRDRQLCFNDDIQGTGAVVLSGFLNAARLASDASGLPLSEHRILFFGAGSAGIGVAKQLMSFFKFNGLSEAEARERIWTVDSKGLITTSRKALQEHKKYFARTDYDGPPMTNLVDIINYVKPTALLGLSTIRNAFNKEAVEAMASHNKRPIIFPLSNPSSVCEVDYEDAVEWTNGKVIFASGSPYQPVVYNGATHEPSQGNNMYIFPGLGLGTLLSKADRVSDQMVEQSAVALAGSLTPAERTADLLYPRLERIRDVSAQIALAVIRTAQDMYIDGARDLRYITDNALLERVKDKMWNLHSPKTRM
ncbi:malate dehydrogenase [Vararia minispora EC-137]|uniref:Malate dehydrogenase n=1 Tax=Vararia minispora EC-137 TaxID=1314806 RepID=A0ACB8QXD1_9AGAM|nr:malate dehydrogenase [Vararia minispora EC-137]